MSTIKKMKPPNILFFGLILLFVPINGVHKHEFSYTIESLVGVPDIKHDFKASVFSSDLQIQVPAKGIILYKMDNMTTGEYDGKLAFPVLKPIPAKMEPFTGREAELLSTTFSSDIHKNNMQYAPTNNLWKTNMMKGVVNMFRINPMINIPPEIQQSLKNMTPIDDMSYTAMEETIFGICESLYTVHITPPEEGFETTFEVKRKRGNKNKNRSEWGYNTKNKGTAYVDMTINFDNCTDNVFIQRSTIGDTTKFGGAIFEEVQYKSFNSRAFIVQMGNYGIFFKNYTGTTLLVTHPYGANSQPLHVYTIQRAIEKPNASLNFTLALDPKAETSKNLKFNYETPMTSKEQQPDWVVFETNSDPAAPIRPRHSLFGINYNTTEIKQYKKDVIDILKRVDEELQKPPTIPLEKVEHSGTSLGDAVNDLHKASAILATLTKEEIDEVYYSVNNSKSLVPELLIDACASAGSGQCVKSLIDYMMHKEISTTRAATILMTLPNTMYAPGIVKDKLWWLARNVYITTTPFYGAASLVNIAAITKTNCIDIHTRNYQVPYKLLGDGLCNRKDVVDIFLSYLTQKLESCQYSWERAIVIQAIGNLGLDEAYNTIKIHAYGFHDKNPGVRVTAVYALQKGKVTENKRNDVEYFLTTLILDPHEDTEVRSAALVVSAQWGRSKSWWEMIARQSWTMISTDLAALIYSTLTSVKNGNDPEQARFAESALLLAKPMQPCLFLSQYRSKQMKNIYKKTKTNAAIGWYSSFHRHFPDEFYLNFRKNFGGIDFDFLQLSISQIGMDDVWEKYFPRQFLVSGSKETKNKEDLKFLSWYREEYGVKDKEYEPQMYIYLKLFNNMQQFITLEEMPIKEYLGGRKPIEELINTLKFSINKYVEPASFEASMPTSAGFPMVLKVSTPTFVSANGEITLDWEGKSPIPTLYQILRSKKYKLNFDLDFKGVSKIISVGEVWTPWNMRTLSTGVSSEKMINIPFSGSYYKTITNNTEYRHNLTLEHPNTNRFPVFYADNIPMVFTNDINIPGVNLSKSADIKVITMEDEASGRPLEQEEYHFGMNSTGISAHYQWYGDFENPLKKELIFDLFRSPQDVTNILVPPTTSFYRCFATIDPENSSTRSSTFIYELVIGWGDGNRVGEDDDVEPTDSDSSLIQTETSETQQRSTVWVKTNEEEEEEEQRGKEITSNKISGNSRSEVRDIFDPNKRVNMYSFIIDFKGVEKFRYDIIYVGSKNRKKSHIADLAFIRAVPFLPDNMNGTCSTINMSWNNVEDWRSLLRYLRNDGLKDFQIRVSNGDTCSKQLIGGIYMVLSISPRRRRFITYELLKGNLRYTNDPTANFVTPALFDQINFVADWNENTPDIIRNNSLNIFDFLKNWAASEQSLDTDYFAKNYENKLLAFGEQPLSSNAWDFQIQAPESNINMNNIDFIPSFMTSLLPLGGVYPDFVIPQHPLFLEHISTKRKSCIVKKSEVILFDATHKTNQIPNKCWQTAVGRLGWGVWTRIQQNKLSVGIIGQDKITIIMQIGYAKVNNRDLSIPANYNYTYSIKDFNGQDIGLIKSSPSSIEGILTDFHVLLTNDYAKININKYFWRNNTQGFCGSLPVELGIKPIKDSNYSLSMIQDMKTYFPHMDTLSSEICEIKSLTATNMNLMSVSNRPPVVCPPGDRYKIVDLGKWTKFVCVSETFITYCHQEICSEKNSRMELFTFKCIKKENAPYVFVDPFLGPWTKVHPDFHEDFFMSIEILVPICSSENS